MMDFQGLASKVKAAASKINFDQMAANDEYIHSDDLNVKGRNNHRRKSSPTETTTSTEQSEEATVRVAVATNQSSSGKANSNSHQPPQQPQQQPRGDWLSSSITTTSSRTQQHNSDDLNKAQSTHAPLADRRDSYAPMLRQSTMPLLSVVANTLAQAQQQQQQYQPASSMKTNSDTVEISRLRKQPANISKQDHDSDSDEEDDEKEEEDDDDDDDDAILNLIRHKNNKLGTKANTANTCVLSSTIRSPTVELGLQKKKNPHRFLNDDDVLEPLSDQSSSSRRHEAPKKKNPKRFLEDLDQRLSTPLDIEAGSTASTTTTSTTAEYEGDTDYYDTNNNSSNNQWSWIRNAVASSRINAMLGQPLPLFKETNNKSPPSVRKGPLSRREVMVPLMRQNDEDDVPVITVHSSSVLGAEEQAELARLSQRSSTISGDFLSAIMDMFKQNPTHSLFLVFTLLLALAAYFYSRNRSISTGLD